MTCVHVIERFSAGDEGCHGGEEEHFRGYPRQCLRRGSGILMKRFRINPEEYLACFSCLDTIRFYWGVAQVFSSTLGREMYTGAAQV